MGEVVNELQRLDLVEYCETFINEGYEKLDDLLGSNESDFIALGMKRAHMRRLVNGLQQYKNNTPPPLPQRIPHRVDEVSASYSMSFGSSSRKSPGTGSNVGKTGSSIPVPHPTSVALENAGNTFASASKKENKSTKPIENTAVKNAPLNTSESDLQQCLRGRFSQLVTQQQLSDTSKKVSEPLVLPSNNCSVDDKTLPRNNKISQTQQIVLSAQSAVKAQNNQKSLTRACRHFNRPAGCWLGDNCSFLHQKGKSKLVEEEKAQEQISANAGSSIDLGSVGVIAGGPKASVNPTGDTST